MASKIMLHVLSIVSVIPAAIWTFLIKTQNEQTEKAAETVPAEVISGDQTTIDVPIEPSSPTPSLATQVMDAAISLDQHNLIHEGAQPLARNSTEHSAQPTPPAPPENEGEVHDLEREFEIAKWSARISASGIFTAIAGFSKGKKEYIDSYNYKGFVLLIVTAFVSSIFLIVLTLERQDIPGFTKIVKFTKWAALVSLTYAICLGTTLLLPKSAAVIVIIVAPLVLLGILIVVPRHVESMYVKFLFQYFL